MAEWMVLVDARPGAGTVSFDSAHNTLAKARVLARDLAVSDAGGTSRYLVIEVPDVDAAYQAPPPVELLIE